MAKRTYGWIRQTKDERDVKFHVSQHMLAVLPQTSNLTSGMGPLLNQGDIGSCGPNSAAEEIMYDQKIAGHPVHIPSRLFIYYNTRVIMGGGAVNQDSGVDNRSMLKALHAQGYCPESLWPYNTALFTHKPPAGCYAAALANRINSYLAVDTDLAAARACLASGFTFLWGGEVFQQIESDQAGETGVLANPAPGETPIGGHDLTVCGVTLVDQPGMKPGNKWPANTIKIRNHWANADGSAWGDAGYGYIPFDYAFNANLAGDFWTIRAAN